jgi:hypothetical protein
LSSTAARVAFEGKPDTKGKSISAAAVGFSPDQRRDVEAYFVETHGRGSCPPGLAKQNNGCLPPGQARKRYVVGQPLPKGVETRPPNAELRNRLGEPPAGHLYVAVDGDLLELAVGTMLVVDAIDGLVH